jgi:Domain of unknown function (DUF5606)
MELKDLASVSGKGGLYKVIKPGKAGVILESLDDVKSRLVVGSNAKISLLDEISIYVRTKEGTTPLGEILRKIKKHFDGDLGVDANSDASELKAFMKFVEPLYDEDRVYVSDIKKLVKWYQVIRNAVPEVLAEPSAENPKD